MRTISYTTRFKKDVKKIQKSGKDMEKLKTLVRLLEVGEVLPAYYKDHKLIGNYRDRRECHIEPDWLLIYKLKGEHIIFERTGTHAELFS